MENIKVGDRVRALSSEGSVGSFTVGKEYIVEEICDAFTDTKPLIRCRSDRGDVRGQFASRWELVKHKFKAGDKVTHKTCVQNSIGEVLRVDGDYVSVNWPTWHGVCRDRLEDLVLHTAVNLPCIVVSEARGASPNPFKHPDREAALAEAERLAKQHPGDTFHVYERVEGRRANVTVDIQKVA